MPKPGAGRRFWMGPIYHKAGGMLKYSEYLNFALPGETAPKDL
jgi:hypothetical protein